LVYFTAIWYNLRFSPFWNIFAKKNLATLGSTDACFQVEFEKDMMREKRETLTNLLLNLMEQQKERQASSSF
jgi:hypothetical protein